VEFFETVCDLVAVARGPVSDCIGQVVSEVCEVLVALVSVRDLRQCREGSIYESPEAVIIVNELPNRIMLSQMDYVILIIRLCLVGILQIEFEFLWRLSKFNLSQIVLFLEFRIVLIHGVSHTSHRRSNCSDLRNNGILSFGDIDNHVYE